MMKDEATSLKEFRNRQFAARGYLVLVDAAGEETVLYTTNTLTRCVKDITPPQTLKPEFGEVELVSPTTTIATTTKTTGTQPTNYFPGIW
jgi:hypothetical protein